MPSGSWQRAVTVSLAGAAVLGGVLVVVLRAGGITQGSRPLLTEAVPCLETSPHQWRILKSVRDRYLGEMGRVNQDLAVRPKAGPEKDSVTELVIERISPSSPLAQAGFQKNDRILEVNGLPIGTMARALGLANEVRAASELDVEIERQGLRIHYRFDFE